MSSESAATAPRCDCPALPVPHTHEPHGPVAIAGALPILPPAAGEPGRPTPRAVVGTLLELEPRWVADYGAPDDAKQGVSFLCPHCRERRLAVFFTPTICGRPPIDIAAFHKARPDNEHLADEHVGSVLWTRTGGDTFETLTLAPSIDASRFGCWHGHITKGRIA